MKNLFRRVFSKLSGCGAFPPGHYYSPIPGPFEIHKKTSLGYPEYNSIDYNKEDQLRLLVELSAHYNDGILEKDKSKRFTIDNPAFSYSDSIFLSCFINNFRPMNIIEVGSGYSTALMLDTFDQIDNYDPCLTCIEPYPDRLKSLLKEDDLKHIELIPTRIQDTQTKIFEKLQSGDLLFIDSSHVCKYGSDVHEIFFRILPILKQGVFVHIHDIHLNFEYNKKWIEQGMYWNEAYILQAFMSYNNQWKIRLFSQYIHSQFAAQISELMPLCLNDIGGSFYMQKT